MDIEPTFHGYIQNELDALLIFQAAIDGKLKLVPRRPYEIERPYLIVSGNIFVFVEESSGIKRWTDGVTWSPSRISGKFLIYREVDRGYSTGAAAMHAFQHGRMVIPQHQQLQQLQQLQQPAQGVFAYHQQMSKYTGFVKKTISMKIKNTEAPTEKERTTRNFHIVSYYLEDDVSFHRLQRPSQCSFFADVKPSPQIIKALDSSMLGTAAKTSVAVSTTATTAKSAPAKHATDRKAHDDTHGNRTVPQRSVEHMHTGNQAKTQVPPAQAYQQMYDGSAPVGHIPQYAAALAQVPVQMPVSVDSWGMHQQYSTASGGSTATTSTGSNPNVSTSGMGVTGNGISVNGNGNGDGAMRMPPYPAAASMYQIPYTPSQQQQSQQQQQHSAPSAATNGIVIGNTYPMYYSAAQGNAASSIPQRSAANGTPSNAVNPGNPGISRSTATATPVQTQNYIPKFPISVNSSTDLAASAAAGGSANIAGTVSSKQGGNGPHMMYSPAPVSQQMYRNSFDSTTLPQSSSSSSSRYAMGMHPGMVLSTSASGNVNSVNAGAPLNTNGGQPGSMYQQVQPGYHFYGQNQVPQQHHSDMMYTHASRDNPRMNLTYAGDGVRGSVYQAEYPGGDNTIATNNAGATHADVIVSNGNNGGGGGGNNNSDAGIAVGNGPTPISNHHLGSAGQVVPARLTNTLTGQTVTDSPFHSSAYPVGRTVEDAAVPSATGQAFNKD